MKKNAKNSSAIIVSIILLGSSVLGRTQISPSLYTFYEKLQIGIHNDFISLGVPENDGYVYYSINPFHDEIVQDNGKLVTVQIAKCDFGKPDLNKFTSEVKNFVSLIISYMYSPELRCIYTIDGGAIDVQVKKNADNAVITKQIHTAMPIKRIAHVIPLQNQDVLVDKRSSSVLSEIDDVELRYYRNVLGIQLYKARTNKVSLVGSSSETITLLHWGPLMTQIQEITVSADSLSEIFVDSGSLFVVQEFSSATNSSKFELGVHTQEIHR